LEGLQLRNDSITNGLIGDKKSPPHNEADLYAVF